MANDRSCDFAPVCGRGRISTAFKIIALGITLSSSYSQAQEMLPRDQGLATYHSAPEYRTSEEHPLRVAAYIVHPIGWLIREGITRPLSYFASSNEMRRSIMGYRYPHDYRTPECFNASDSIPDCRTLSPFNYSDSTGGSEVSNVYFPNVNFDFNARTLNARGKEVVATIAKTLVSESALRVVLQGHTDYVGSNAYNDALGMDRARAVLNELVSLGIDEERLSAVSFGETAPLVNEKSDQARATNRRVEVH
jgi:outer membrane protein OmpA-like peptidoglycan-associated protein